MADLSSRSLSIPPFAANYTTFPAAPAICAAPIRRQLSKISYVQTVIRLYPQPSSVIVSPRFILLQAQNTNAIGRQSDPTDLRHERKIRLIQVAVDERDGIDRRNNLQKRTIPAMQHIHVLEGDVLLNRHLCARIVRTAPDILVIVDAERNARLLDPDVAEDEIAAANFIFRFISGPRKASNGKGPFISQRSCYNYSSNRSAADVAGASTIRTLPFFTSKRQGFPSG